MEWVSYREIDALDAAITQYEKRQLDDAKLTAMRLQNGVYGQRQAGEYMVRIKVPGGILFPQQIDAIADVLERYSSASFANITTRQDIQLHFVKLNHVAAVLRRLADVGLTTREACGNTVRNITTCVLAGVCPRERTDVRAVLHPIAKQFIRNPMTQHLPRKFKIALSGCEVDCAQSAMHDLAAIAVKHGEHFGFKVLAGGGLGHKPKQAIVIEECVSESQLPIAFQAVLNLHNRYSDRTKRAKSRVKFLVDRFGRSEFIAKYKAEFARLIDSASTYKLPILSWRQVDTSPRFDGSLRRVVEQKQAQFFSLPLSVPLGDIDAPRLRGIAAIMREFQLTDIRATQEQNLILTDIQSRQLDEIRQRLAGIGVTESEIGDDVVACPGTWTCRLGITAARDMAKHLSGSDLDLKIRVSGCHNGCAQPHAGDIGLHGEAKRLHGKLVPHYRLHFAGSARDQSQYAVEGPEIPVTRVNKAVKRVLKTYRRECESTVRFQEWAQLRGSNYFTELLADLAEVRADDIANVARDFGQQTDFRVLALGGGECASVNVETRDATFSEAQYELNFFRAFIRQQKWKQASECASIVIRRIGQVWILSEHKSIADDANIIQSILREQFPGLYPTYIQLSAILDSLRTSNAPSEYERFANVLEQRIEQAYANDQLAFMSAEKIPSTPESFEFDTSLLPVQLLKVKSLLANLRPGEEFDILVPTVNVQAIRKALTTSGFAVIDTGVANLEKTRLRVTGRVGQQEVSALSAS